MMHVGGTRRAQLHERYLQSDDGEFYYNLVRSGRDRCSYSSESQVELDVDPDFDA